MTGCRTSGGPTGLGSGQGYSPTGLCGPREDGASNPVLLALSPVPAAGLKPGGLTTQTLKACLDGGPGWLCPFSVCLRLRS